MRHYELKEIRRHGSELLPVCEYEINPMSGLQYLSCHWHDEMELFKIEKGCMNLRCGDTFFFAKQGSLILINSGELHAAEPVGNDEIIYRALVFSPDFLCGNDLACSKYINGVITKKIILPTILNFEPSLLGLFDKIYEKMLEKPLGYELSVKAALLNIFALSLKHSTVHKQPLDNGSAARGMKSVLKFMQENYKRPLTIQELSKICNVSEGHFYRLFKEYTLKTPVHYLNNLRTTAAMELLTSTNRKTLDIAMETGFNGVGYFTDVFKSSTGLTPAKFRKKYANGEFL